MINLKRDWASWAAAGVAAWSVAAILAVTSFAQPVESPDRFGGISVTASATGTTGATPASIPAVPNKVAYVCGISIRANATAAATGTATLAGVVSGTMSFVQWTAPLASGLGVLEPPFNVCIPATGVNVAITLTSAAPGAGGTVTTTLWGYYL